MHNLSAILHRPRLLIVGCGDVGLRLVKLLGRRFRVFAVTRDAGRAPLLRAAGAVPVVADLDCPASLARLSGLAPWVVHLAPPAREGEQDARTRRLLAALGAIRRLVYVSTSGVYGDCGGALVNETRPPAPGTARARRRLDAEQVLRQHARCHGTRLSILRVPGIYDGGARLPLARLAAGTPALAAGEDVYTNHLHADDLARIVLRALMLGAGGRVYNASDDTRMKMGDYFDAVADACALARPPRLARTALAGVLTPLQMSFMRESRRIDNTRIKRELRVRLHYPDVGATLRALASTQASCLPKENKE